MWQVWGERFESADLNGGLRVFQPVTFNDDIVLNGVTTWLIVMGDPTFTSLTMKIYSDQGNAPGSLIYTSSDTITKTELITENNGIKSALFQFGSVSLKGTTKYHIVLHETTSSYTGTTSSMLAWRKTWPDPEYRTNVVTTGSKMDYVDLLIAPYSMGFHGADL